MKRREITALLASFLDACYAIILFQTAIGMRGEGLHRATAKPFARLP